MMKPNKKQSDQARTGTQRQPPRQSEHQRQVEPALPGLDALLIGLASPGRQRATAAHRLQRTVGNQVVSRLLGDRRPAVSGAIIQRRRIPPRTQLNALLPAGGSNLSAHEEGLLRVLRRAISEMSAAEIEATFNHAVSGHTLAELNAMSDREKILLLAEAMQTARPDTTLGDPALIDTGPRTGTSDAANITTLVNNADSFFADVAAGTHDAHLEDVFGTTHVATAKTRYAAARTRMNFLHGQNKIVTDRSGYNDEVGLGGLTNSAQISVESSVIDNPSADGSVVTMIHESMHAGNNSVRDFGYIDQPSFTRLAANVKLDNAAHYEVPARRALGLAPTFAGQTFVPAGTSGSSGSAPPLTDMEQAIRDASELFRKAWTVGLNLHTFWVRLLHNPGQWTTTDLGAEFGVASGLHWADCMPFWSKVQLLTVHEKTTIDTTGADAGAAPVSQIDVALSEGLVRLLDRAMGNMTSEAGTEGAALALEAAYATTAERAAATTVALHRDLLMTIILRDKVGDMTGATDRDLRVVKRLAQADGPTFSGYLAARNPASFT